MEKITVDEFNEQLHALEVFESYERNIVKATSLDLYRPFDMLMDYDSGIQYIVPIFYL